MLSAEQSDPTTRPTELLDGEVVDKLSPAIRLPADALGVDIWQQLVDKTQSDHLEHAAAIGRRKNGTYVIFEGYADPGLDDPGLVSGASLAVPSSPFGIIKGFAQRIKKETLVHTHPMGTELDHVRTSVISDEDIHQFIHSDYKVLVMLDRGGAHLLARTNAVRFSGVFPPPDLVDTAIHETLEDGGGSMDLLALVGARLSSFGLGYYYTPDLPQQGDTVEFQNLRVVETAVK